MSKSPTEISKKRQGDMSDDSPKKKRVSETSDSKSKEMNLQVSDSNNSKSDSDGLTFDLGNKKKVTIKDFKNKVYVHIREFYEKDGNLLPGKKGISLTIEQWKILEGLVKTISKEAETLQAQLE